MTPQICHLGTCNETLSSAVSFLSGSVKIFVMLFSLII